jgi:hypothetical protein
MKKQPAPNRLPFWDDDLPDYARGLQGRDDQDPPPSLDHWFEDEVRPSLALVRATSVALVVIPAHEHGAGI